ncbi:16S rRNA (cytidine(1402)-2'-O)-methyltransferase [Candidatus Microgenomates bacterium]|nr:16S rRNA (cytidine(1402)-2'-O)-methyltransferase [Candidatus Microgenomates bacterium]
MLYIVGTPIGNLGDVTLRALEVLKSVDFVLAEDTRVTKKLLDKYNIKIPLISYHEHSKNSREEEILKLLQNGKNLALVTDAGTPGIADPGNRLIEKIYTESSRGETSGDSPRSLLGTNIVPIPGASSLTSILSVCGFPTDQFLFLGFLPKKKGRQTLLQSLKKENRTIIFFESPHRIVKTLKELENFLGDREAVVGRELTKIFEEIKRGTLSELSEYFGKKKQKGEFVVAINKKLRK